MIKELTCDRMVPGCLDCEAEQDYQDSIGHVCDEHSDRFTTLCELRGEGRRSDEEYHQMSHEPERCEACHEIVDDHLGATAYYTRLCPAGLCPQVVCSHCNEVTSSFGPIDCPTCGSLGRRPAVTRMRSLYRVKRKHW